MTIRCCWTGNLVSCHLSLTNLSDDRDSEVRSDLDRRIEMEDEQFVVHQAELVEMARGLMFPRLFVLDPHQRANGIGWDARPQS